MRACRAKLGWVARARPSQARLRPGEPGFGPGLTVAIANTARLGGCLRLLAGPGATLRVELPPAPA